MQLRLCLSLFFYFLIDTTVFGAPKNQPVNEWNVKLNYTLTVVKGQEEQAPPKTATSVDSKWNYTLTCNCTYGQSRYCTPSGTCDAATVGQALLKEVEQAQWVMKALMESPADQQKRELRDKICETLEKDRNGTDLLLLDYVEDHWEPACVRMGNSKAHTCSLAPKNVTQGLMNREKINAKLRQLHEFLNCSSQNVSSSIDGDVYFCKSVDNCNAAPTVEADEGAELQQALAGGDAQLSPTKKILFYGVVPAIALLILLAFILFIACYHYSAWSYVYKVAKRQKEAGLL